jgi:hypothetical protein
MTEPCFHGFRPQFSASLVLTNLGNSLSLIRAEDKLTWNDVGAVLGKSADQAAKYADGTSDMGVVSYARGKREWSGRFSGSLMRLCYGCSNTPCNDRLTAAKTAQVGMLLNEALATGDTVPASLIHQNRSAIESLRDSLDALLRRTEVHHG